MEENNVVDEYVEKKRIMRTTLSLKNIDRYDYEANCFGCKIDDYDKFERHRNNEISLFIGVLGMYFIIGMLIGAVAVLSVIYHI